jgi:hypothetical protein
MALEEKKFRNKDRKSREKWGRGFYYLDPMDREAGLGEEALLLESFW